MDLLQGYGSDSSSSEAPPPKLHQPTATTKEAPAVATDAPKTKKRGKRLLSLQAVLPPKILDGLYRPEESDSDDEEKVGKRSNIGGDRSGVKSLLEELRSAPLQNGGGKKQKSNVTKDTTRENEGLGLAFMSYTTECIRNNGEVIDVHADKLIAQEATVNKPKEPEPVKAAPKQPIGFSRMSAAAPVPRSMQQSAVATTTTAYQTYHKPEVATQQTTTYSSYTSAEQNYPETNNANTNSRKHRREQERSLRSGAAFQTSNTVELHQPSPSEYAPTAHMAAIASRAAHLRNLGTIDPSDTSNYGEYASHKAKSAGVAMYDPKTGADVKGGVTGKHKSKHQINQLMVSAIGLEASRAGEAELARLGLGRGPGKASGGRAEAKSKYGW